MTSTEARERLAALEAEYQALSEERTRLEARIEAIKLRHRALSNMHARTGEIVAARYALDHALRVEADAARFTVATAGPDRYVVSRVTPKRIYVRRAGETYEHTLDRDGRSETKYGGIEVLNREELVKYADEVGPRRAK